MGATPHRLVVELCGLSARVGAVYLQWGSGLSLRPGLLPRRAVLAQGGGGSLGAALLAYTHPYSEPNSHSDADANANAIAFTHRSL